MKAVKPPYRNANMQSEPDTFGFGVVFTVSFLGAQERTPSKTKQHQDMYSRNITPLLFKERNRRFYSQFQNSKVHSLMQSYKTTTQNHTLKPFITVKSNTRTQTLIQASRIDRQTTQHHFQKANHCSLLARTGIHPSKQRKAQKTPSSPSLSETNQNTRESIKIDIQSGKYLYKIIHQNNSHRCRTQYMPFKTYISS